MPGPASSVTDVDVVIVAYNRFDLTESCLAHLGHQTRAHRVIVVDNGSTDDTGLRLAADWPEVHLIRIDTDRPSFAVACNRGASASDGDFLVLLNNDVDCDAEFVERVVAPLEEDPGLGSVAAMCLRPGREHIDSVGLTVDVTLAGFPRMQGQQVTNRDSARPVLTGPAGAAAAYRRAAWEQAGGLDERIFAYSEDVDLALRLRASGWGTTAATDAIGVHLGSASHGHRSSWQRRHAGFGRAYLARRYGLLRGRARLRTALTEALVVMGDAVISRDAAALKGRAAGWRAARGLPPRTPPPPEAVDHEISIRDSIDLRRGVYAQDTR